MKALISDLLTNIGFIFTAIYAILNLIAMIIVEFDFWDNIGWFAEFVLGIDVFTWIVYGIFSVLTLLLKLRINSKAVDNGHRVKWLDLQAILHFVFMIISFGGIYYLFENCF